MISRYRNRSLGWLIGAVVLTARLVVWFPRMTHLKTYQHGIFPVVFLTTYFAACLLFPVYIFFATADQSERKRRPHRAYTLPDHQPRRAD